MSGSAPQGSEHQDSASQDRGPDVRLLKFAAPALLSALACVQLVLGLFFGLTPWKGGGFGMFSTIDSNGARSMRVYLDTDKGEVPTKAPSWLGERRNHAHSLPAGFRLQSIAEELAGASWVYSKKDTEASQASPSDSKEPASDHPAGEAPDEALPAIDAAARGVDRPEGVVQSAEPEEPSAKPSAKDAAMDGRGHPRVAAQRAGKSIGDRTPVEVKAVRVEVWTKRFDFDTNQLQLEFMAQATAKAGPR